ncbi:MAG: diguanylate cyclase [Deltaproteobacteria bacterium]|nr:diguanylate cyclase [Deltaproteobacteria bacterium]
MTKSKIDKKTVDKIGRSFALLFNRVAMYNLDHPFTVESMNNYYRTVADGLGTFSPIVLIMHQEQFFLEEEPLDSRINTSKMVIHFKKAGIQSISFEKGMKADELNRFVGIFSDLAKHPTADHMKKALLSNGVKGIKINHIIFKKMTADDKIVSKDTVVGDLSRVPKATQSAAKTKFMDMMVENIVMEEVEKSISIKSLMEDPTGVSKAMIDKDLSASKVKGDGTGHADASGASTDVDPSASGGSGEGKGGSDDGKGRSGDVIIKQLDVIKKEVETAMSGTGNIEMPELASAVLAMKKDLLEQIEAQKAMGVVFENEGMIRDETDAIMDGVLIGLIKDEYKKGKVSIQRLGQIIRRMVPDPEELKRLMPKIKEALIKEGMSLPDFAQLAEELGKELQSEELAQVLKKSAEEIGVDGEELIREFQVDPGGAAELIYLASEIKKGTGDEKVLSDLLVDYVERIGSKISLDAAGQKGEEGGKYLKDIISKVESEIVGQLKQKDINNDVISSVQNRLEERMEECFNKLQSDWASRYDDSAGGNGKSILDIFEEDAEEGTDLKAILESVRSSVQEGGLDVNDFKQVFDEVSKRKLDQHRENLKKEELKKEAQQKQKQEKEEGKKKTQEKKEQEKKKEKPGLPKGVLNRSNTLYFIEKEISRAVRYGTTFSIMLLSIFKVTPEKSVPKGMISRDNITNAVLAELAEAVRDTDTVGLLDKKKILILLPMTGKTESKMAMSRIMKALKAEPFIINDYPLAVKIVGIVSLYDNDRAQTLKSYIKASELELYNMINRLKNVQDLY